MEQGNKIILNYPHVLNCFALIFIRMFGSILADLDASSKRYLTVMMKNMLGGESSMPLNSIFDTLIASVADCTKNLIVDNCGLLHAVVNNLSTAQKNYIFGHCHICTLQDLSIGDYLAKFIVPPEYFIVENQNGVAPEKFIIGNTTYYPVAGICDFNLAPYSCVIRINDTWIHITGGLDNMAKYCDDDTIDSLMAHVLESGIILCYSAIKAASNDFLSAFEQLIDRMLSMKLYICLAPFPQSTKDHKEIVSRLKAISSG